MDEKTIREQVAETGRLLLERKLVARTWGNFSARLDETHFAITPSGLGYEKMTADDIVRFCHEDGSYEGHRKPSSEKGIHAAAYRLFPETGFVIHTHQAYATSLGLSSPEQFRLSEKERESLGGIAWAEYGLPGTKKLKNAVAAALRTGSHTVLMKHHGALICGIDRTEALQRALLLEDICRRNWRCDETIPATEDNSALLARIQKVLPKAALEEGDASRAWSTLQTPLRTQLDDVAQMIGLRIPFAKCESELMEMLKKNAAVFVQGVGAVVHGEDSADTAALQVLTDKAALAALHTRALNDNASLSLFDCLLMRQVYRLKYAKKKKG